MKTERRKWVGSNFHEWYGECLRKKKLREEWADDIISKAFKNQEVLYKYHCPHCFGWHVTRKPFYKNMR